MKTNQAQIEVFHIAFKSLPTKNRDELLVELAKDYSEEDLEDLIDRAIISIRKNDSTISLEELNKKLFVSSKPLDE